MQKQGNDHELQMRREEVDGARVKNTETLLRIMEGPGGAEALERTGIAGLLVNAQMSRQLLGGSQGGGRFGDGGGRIYEP